MDLSSISAILKFYQHDERTSSYLRAGVVGTIPQGRVDGPWLVRSAQAQDVPPGVLQFLRRHEEEESLHLQQFEQLLETTSRGKTALPRVPSQWCVLAVHLYGYEVLGLQFARLLVSVAGLSSILKDEEVHVGFFENEIVDILLHGGPSAQGAAGCTGVEAAPARDCRSLPAR